MTNKMLMAARIIDRAGGRCTRAEVQTKMGAAYSKHTLNRLRGYGYIECNPPGNPGAAGPPDLVLTDLGRQYAHTGQHPLAKEKTVKASSPAPMPKPPAGPSADPKAEALRVLTEYRNKLAADLVKVNAAIGELTR